MQGLVPSESEDEENDQVEENLMVRPYESILIASYYKGFSPELTPKSSFCFVLFFSENNFRIPYALP